jgi:hypothetical protein
MIFDSRERFDHMDEDSPHGYIDNMDEVEEL